MRKNILALIVSVFLMLFTCGSASAAPLFEYVSTNGDAHIYAPNGSQNYGNATALGLGYSGRMSIFLKPNFSRGNRVIVGGSVLLRISGGNNVTYNGTNLSSNWVESTITANNRPAAGAFATNYYTSGNIEYVDLGEIPKTWNTYDYGVALESGSSLTSYFYSEETGGNGPQFKILYYNPPASISVGASSTQSTITPSWGSNGNDGNATYSLFRNGNLIYKGTATSFTDTGLQGATAYSYTVYTSCDDSNGTTYYSAGVSGTFYTAPPTPNAPTGTATGLAWSSTTGRGKVVLNWSSVTTATGYKVWIFDGYDYRIFNVGNTLTWDSSVAKIYPDESWLNAQADNSVSSDPFNHAGGGFDLRDDPAKLYIKTIGTTYDSSHNYWFRVSAYNAYGESPISNAYMPTLTNRTDTTIPSGTISVTVPEGAVAPATVTVNLSSITDSESGLYQMQFSNDGTSYSALQAFATTKSWTTSSGEGQKIVYARVKDNVGNTATFTVNFWLGASLTQIYNEAQAGSQKAEAARLAAEESKINSNAAKTAAEAASTNSGIAATNATTASDRAYYTGRYGGSTESVADLAGYVRNTQLPAMDTKIDNMQTTVNNMASADTLPPAVDLKTVSGAVATSGGSINIIVAVSDNRSTTFTYSLDGTTYQVLPLTGIISAPVSSPGPNVITVRVKDEANNMGSKSMTIRKL